MHAMPVKLHADHSTFGVSRFESGRMTAARIRRGLYRLAGVLAV